jgi:hypothetical protein
MTSAVKLESETNTFWTAVRIGVLVAWLGVGFFISGVMNDLLRLSENPPLYNPATLVLAMFVISSIVIAVFWFGKGTWSIDRVIRLPSASTLKTQFAEAITDDASMQGLHGQTFE